MHSLILNKEKDVKYDVVDAMDTVHLFLWDKYCINNSQ